MAQDHNPLLKAFLARARGTGPEKGSIEHAGDAANIEWQTRPSPPSDYENALGDALVACFEEGIEELAPLVKRLDERGVKAPDGAAWTEESFQAVLARLGA
jgi:hypothetical protein